MCVLNQQWLKGFGSVSLEEMEGVKLLDRAEVKYMMPAGSLQWLLQQLENHYKILEIKALRASRYETIYFDSDDFQLFRMHHNGRVNRYKLRIRKYPDSELAFYEIKVKNAKKRTVKVRIPYQYERASEQSIEPFRALSDAALDKLPECKPTLKVEYTRITFVAINSPERLTIDTDLAFTSEGERRTAPPMVIAEVKQEKNGRSPFISIMHQHHFAPLRMSKYCYGLIMHHPGLKQNNFKPRLRRISKIINSKQYPGTL